MSNKPPIKLLSLWQPWASLCIWTNPEDGKAEKQIETRHWATDYRGLVAIHGTSHFHFQAKLEIKSNLEVRKALSRRYSALNLSYLVNKLTFGAILGVVTLEKIVQFDEKQIFLELFPDREKHFGDHTPGRFGWYFTNPIEFKTTIECRGLQSLGTPKPEIIDQIFEQMEVSK